MSPPEFKAFPKISRLVRECVVTEKIDGTNALVYVDEGGEVFAGSRTRWITPESDNYGFARWVADHAPELRDKLGAGAHYGEWWGAGIQRRYGLAEKRFSLFNVGRWTEENKPDCCHVVPVVYRGLFSSPAIEEALEFLRVFGSQAAPGFMHPEGVVVFHTASSTLYKRTLEKDADPKGRA